MFSSTPLPVPLILTVDTYGWLEDKGDMTLMDDTVHMCLVLSLASYFEDGEA